MPRLNNWTQAHQQRADWAEDSLRQIDDAQCNLASIAQSLSETGNDAVSKEWQEMADALYEMHQKIKKLAR